MELDFERPDGCVAEGHVSWQTEAHGGNDYTITGEVKMVCADELGPFKEKTTYNGFNSERRADAIDALLMKCSKVAGRLITPYCAQCPNNPNYQK